MYCGPDGIRGSWDKFPNLADENNFCGDVVLNSFNKTSRDEDNILDQIYKSKHIQIIIMLILILHTIIGKCILTKQKQQKSNFMSFLLLCDVMLFS